MSDKVTLLVIADKKQSKKTTKSKGGVVRFVKTKTDKVLTDNMPVDESYVETFNEGFPLSGIYLEVDKKETEKYQKAEKAKSE